LPEALLQPEVGEDVQVAARLQAIASMIGNVGLVIGVSAERNLPKSAV